MPEGVRRSLNSPWGLTTVWPALSPPEKRTTYFAFSASISTILPFPSSPHWAPITAATGMFTSLSQNPYILPSRAWLVYTIYSQYGSILRLVLSPCAAPGVYHSLDDGEPAEKRDDSQGDEQGIVESTQQQAQRHDNHSLRPGEQSGFTLDAQPLHPGSDVADHQRAQQGNADQYAFGELLSPHDYC